MRFLLRVDSRARNHSAHPQAQSQVAALRACAAARSARVLCSMLPSLLPGDSAITHTPTRGTTSNVTRPREDGAIARESAFRPCRIRAIPLALPLPWIEDATEVSGVDGVVIRAPMSLVLPEASVICAPPWSAPSPCSVGPANERIVCECSAVPHCAAVTPGFPLLPSPPPRPPLPRYLLWLPSMCG